LSLSSCSGFGWSGQLSSPSGTLSLSRSAPAAAVTVMVTVAVAKPPSPSLTVYVKVTVPVKPGSGSYRIAVPPLMIVTVPCSGWVTDVMVRLPPSLSSTLITVGPPPAGTMVESSDTGTE
jgi:hypothetical protein